MAEEMAVEAAERNLREVLNRMRSGETMILIGPDGAPVAAILSLKAECQGAASAEDWDAEWDAVAHEVGKAWNSDTGAVEAVAEQRR